MLPQGLDIGTHLRVPLECGLGQLAAACLGIVVGVPWGYWVADYFFTTMSSSEDVGGLILSIFPQTYVIAVLSALVILLVSQIPAICQVQRLSLSTALKD